MEQTYIGTVLSLARDGLGMSDSAAGTLALRAARDPDRKVDIIQGALNFHINEYRAQSFENFSLDVYVHPSQRGASIHIAQNGVARGNAGVNIYKFSTADGHQKRMYVRPVKGNILIAYRERWQTIDAYLDALKQDLSSRASIAGEGWETAWRKQLEWWASNGKAFRLLDLPAEIRENIYRFALIKPTHPYPTHKARRLGYSSKIALKEDNPVTNLMSVSRRVRVEASHLFYRDAPFVIANNPIMHKVLTNLILSANIRHLHLALSHGQYLKLFGFQFSEVQSYSNYGGAVVSIIRDMRLDSLTLQIDAPRAVGDEMWADGACQRVVVSWIFEAAWPWIRGHPFKFTGFVKDGQRKVFAEYADQELKLVEKWQTSRLNWGLGTGTLREYHEFIEGYISDEDGGVRLDGSRGGEREWPLERLEVHGDDNDGRLQVPRAPICMCRVPCSRATWTTED